MADDLNIILKAQIGQTNKDINDLDTQIKQLSDKLTKVNLNLGLDSKLMSTLDKFVLAMDKAQNLSKEMTRSIKEEVTEIKKLDGSVERVTRQFLRNGEIIEKTKNIIKGQVKETENATKSTGMLLDEWDAVGKKIKEVTKLNGQGEVTGGSQSFLDGHTKQTINYDANDHVTSARTVEDFAKQEKAVKDFDNQIVVLVGNVKELRSGIDKLGGTGLSTTKDMQQLDRAIELALKNPSQTVYLEKANNLYKELFDNIKRIQGLGTKTSNISPDVFSFSDDKKVKTLTEYVREAYQAKGASDDLEKTQISLARSFDKAGNEIYKYNIAIKDGSGVAKTYAGSIDKLSASLYENSIKTKDATTRSLGLTEQFKIAASRVPIWLGATTLYFGTLRTLQNIVSTIVEVDTKMTELKRVMSSDTNFNQFLSNSISLSTELSRNLNDVLDIANEFARQGYSAQETLDLTKVAGMLQNISDLTPDQSLDAIISAMKNYNIEASQAITIADKLNEVDNNYSVSTQQLATSMFKAASTAKAYGVTLDSLIGQTTAVAETTRESGNVVGNFLKTLYSRMLSTSQSVNALKDVGIEVKNTNGEMRTATEVLTQLHDKWGSLSKAQQQSLALNVAGERQISRFFALMQNYGDSISAANTALNSQNSAVRENAKYQDSLQARITRLQTAWQNLSLQMGDAVITDSLINIVQSLTSLANVASKVVDKVGVLPFVFGGISTAVILLSGRLRGLATSIIFAESAEVGFTVATEAMATALRSLVSATVIGAVFAVLGLAIEKLIGHYGKLRAEQEKQKQQTKELVDSYKANKDEVSSLADQYEKMSSQVATGDLSKTDKEYLDVQTQLGKILPTTIDYISKSGQVHLKTSDSIKKEIDSLKELAKLDSQKFVEDFSNKLDSLNEKILATSSSIKKYNIDTTSTGNFNASGSNPVTFKQTPLTTEDKMNNIVKEQEYQAQLNDRVNLFKQLSSEYQNFLGVQDTLTKADNDYIDTLIENNKAQLATKKGQKEVENQVKTLIGSYGELRKAFGSGVDFSHIFEGMDSKQIASIASLVKGYKDGGESVQQFTKLLKESGYTTDQVIAITNALTDAKKEDKVATDAQAQAQQTLTQILSGSLSVEDALAQAVLGYTKDQIDSNSKLIEIYAGLSKAKNLDASQSALLTQVYDELKSRFPDLVKGHDVSITALYGEANAQSVLYQAVVASANGQLDAEHQKTLGMALELQNQKKIVEQQIKLYQKGLDAYVASEMVQNNGRFAMNGAMMANYHRIQDMANQVDNVIVPKIQKAAISLGKYLNVSPQFKTPDWNYDSGSSGSKSGSKDSKSTADTQKVNKYQTDVFSQALAKLDLQIKESDARLGDLDKSSKEYRDELAHQIDLIEQEEKLTKDQINSLNKKNDALKHQLSAMGAYNKLSNDQKNTYNDIAKAIDDNINKINDLSGTMVDYGNKVKDIQSQVLDSFSAVEDMIVNNINTAMQASDDSYDSQIKKLQDKLDLMDQEYEKEDRIAKLRDIQNQIDTTKADKRFEYINANGQVELTYDKGKVSDLEKQQDDLIQQYNREDAKQAIQDEIDRLQKEKDDKHKLYEQQIADMNDFWDTITKAFQDGSLTLDEFMKDFYGNSLEEITKYAGDVGKQTEIIKGLFDDLGKLNVDAAKYGTGLNPGDKVDAQDAATANQKLKTDPAYKQEQIDRTKAIIYNRLKQGLDVSRQEDYLHYIESFHTGGVVSNSPNKMTEIANKLLNTRLQPNESVIKVLKGELLSPAANIAQNLIPNLRMLTNFVRPQQMTPVSADNHYHFDHVEVKANNLTEFLNDIHFMASTRRT